MDYKLTYNQYQQGLENGEFLGILCHACDTVTFPPMGVCRNCNGTDLEVIRLSGKGTLRTFTVIRVAPEGMNPPYIVAMAELEEGPWTMGNLLDVNPDATDMSLIGKNVQLGSQPVKGDIFSGGDSRVVTFTLTEG